MLVYVCLLDTTEEYRVFSENLSFLSFSKLMEAARHTKESVCKSSRSSMSCRHG